MSPSMLSFLLFANLYLRWRSILSLFLSCLCIPCQLDVFLLIFHDFLGIAAILLLLASPMKDAFAEANAILDGAWTFYKNRH